MSQFTALPAATEGVGPYRMNRFRIYFQPLTAAQRASGFRHNRPAEQIAAELASEFKSDFPRFFNPNMATVSSRSEQYNSHPTLRFHLGANLFGINHAIADYLAPDVHTDWVGVHRDHSRGFTVQTLKREFFEGVDFEMAAVTGAGTVAAGAGIGAGIGFIFGGIGAGPGAIAGTKIGAAASLVTMPVAVWINRYHFLAGRRSWVFRTKQEWGRTGVANYDEIPDDAIGFETAAVERLSGRIFQAADFTRVLGSFDNSIRQVWLRLMTNYLARKDFAPVPARVWSQQAGPVSLTEPPHRDTLIACKSDTEYGDIIRSHEQMLD